jgi:hypothetical protein
LRARGRIAGLLQPRQCARAHIQDFGSLLPRTYIIDSLPSLGHVFLSVIKKATVVVAFCFGWCGGGYCASALFWLIVVKPLIGVRCIKNAAVVGLKYSAQCAVLGRLK